MRIVCISDTHRQPFSCINFPDGDILIHCGDGVGEYDRSVKSLNKEFEKLPHKHKLYIPGNHDGFIYCNLEEAEKLLTNARILIDKEIVIEGIRIYGSPWTPLFNDWYFMFPRNGFQIEGKWKAIPSGIDILVTHGPPFGILDVNEKYEHTGCEILYKEVTERVKPKYSIFGHIHEARGIRTPMELETTFVNCSFVDARYIPRNEPIVFDI